MKNKKNTELVEKYIDYLQYNCNFSQKTYMHYKKVLLDFLIFIENRSLEEISINDFENYFIQKKAKLKNNSKNNYIIIIRKFLFYLVKFEHMNINFVEKIETLKNKYDIQLPFSVNEMKLIFKKLENNQCAFIIKLLYFSAIRVSEVIEIKLEDIDLKNNTIKINGKGDKQRLIFIPEILKHEVLKQMQNKQKYLLEIENKPLKRYSINQMLNDFGIKNNLKFKIYPHKFRRSFATHLIELGMDVRELQVYLGHDSILSTEKYIVLSKDKLKNKVLNAFKKT